jgi:hypothetical protein
VLVPSAALVTACAVLASALSRSGEALSVAPPAVPQPTSTTTLTLPQSKPRPAVRPPRLVMARARVAAPQQTQPAYAFARSGAHTALIVGIDDNDPSNPLLGADADATNMRNALLKYGFGPSDVVVLLDGQATHARILSELQRLVARTPPDGVAVFAAASHGAGTSFRTAEGARLYASELGRYLGRIRAPVWTALAMCYAAGFAVPGVVGPNRIATFSSAANQLTYELGGVGSELYYAMVKQGMIDAGAPRSVESAFNFAYRTLAKDYTDLPVMSDGVPGELVLGPVTWGPPAAPPPPTPPPVPVQPDDQQPVVVDPTPSPANGGLLGGVLCGLLGCHRQH